MLTKDLHYKNYPVSYRVECLNVDITRHLLNVGPISSSLDVQVIGEFTISNTTITLRNADGLFTPSNPSNFFIANSGNMEGYLAAISVYIGFEVEGNLMEELVLDGEIIDVNPNAKGDVCSILISDKSQKIRNQEVEELGIEKSLTIPITDQNTAVLQKAVQPISARSDRVRAFLNPGDTTFTRLDRKDHIRSEGVQSPRNYQVEPTRIEIEGEPSYDQIQVQADFPLRHKRIETLINEVLDNYSISTTGVEINDSNAEFTRELHISSNGRVGYDTDSSVRDIVGDWMFEGYVTRFLHNPTTNEYFFTYTSRDRETFPQIIKYSVADDEYTIVYKASTNYEFWNMATADFDTFYILYTVPRFTGGFPDLGTYDASEVGTSPVAIARYRVSTNNFETDFIDRTASHKPQLANNLVQGTTRANLVPDSRRHMFATAGTVYYPYIDSTSFGVANGVDEGLANALTDDYKNNCGFDFVREGTSIWMASTRVDAFRSESTFYVHRFTF